MDLKILITATLLEADKAELQQKIEAMVMDFREVLELEGTI